MMQFRTMKAWLIAYLGAHAAAGGYRVVGYNDSNIDTSQLTGANRLVQVFAKGGDFSGAFCGPVDHKVGVSVELLTACPAAVDLTVLDNPAATPVQITAALAASQNATQRADDDFDEFVEVIYQHLMANDQLDLGHPGEVGGRWAPSWKKGSPLVRGQNVIISGSIEFSFRVGEDLTGVTPTTPTAHEAVSVAIKASANDVGTPQAGSAVLAGG